MRLKIALVLLVVIFTVAALMHDRFDPAVNVRPVNQSSLVVKDYDRSKLGSVSRDPMPSLQVPMPTSSATDSSAQAERASASKSAERFSALENKLQRLQDTTAAYLMLIDALKSELHLKENELEKLQSTVEQYASEITMLTENLARKNAAVNSAYVDGRIDDKTMEASRHRAVMEQVDYFSVAKRVEASAKKIRSSDLKREHLLEALEVYKKAFSSGRKEAAQNIDELEQILFPSSTLARTQ